jgi:cytochrome c oxidase subunit IV
MERDDIIEYSLDAHHSEEEGVKIRKKIYFVTFLLSVITIVEVLVGVFFGKGVFPPDSFAWKSIVLFYIILTLVKAGYIVMVFMHLGDERKSFRWTILAPYIFFMLYLVFLVLTEASFMYSYTH